MGHWRLGFALEALGLKQSPTVPPFIISVLLFGQLKSATLQRFQLAFKHLLLLEKNSRLHAIFQDFTFNFHTFSRSGKVVCKFPDFFKNSRLCTNPVKVFNIIRYGMGHIHTINMKI